MSSIAYSSCGECREPIRYDEPFHRDPEPIHADCYIKRLSKEISDLKNKLAASEMRVYGAEARGMERAAVIAEKSIQHVFVNKRHVADVDGRIPAKAIREEIDK